MPNVRRAHAKFQFTEYNYWEHIFSLLPEKDQELKKEVSDMIMNTVFFTQNTQPVPDGEFIVKNREGKKVKLSGDDLIEGTKETPKYIPVDDPEYAQFFKEKLNLLDRIEKKYSGKNHEALKQEIGILRCKNQNLAKGVGYEFAPGDYIIIGTNGLQKFQDVLFDTEEAEKNGTDDRMKWKLKDPALVEKTMEEFGVTDIHLNP